MMVNWENTWEEIKEADPDIAIVPISTIEQHGRHLPVGTDWLIALAHAEELAEALDAYLLPAMPYGCSVEHMQYPGTVTLRPTTLAAFLEDMVISLYRQGFRKIVVLSTHGGNWVLKPFLRELSFSYPDLMVIWPGPQTLVEDMHSGENETSAMLHYYPEMVREPREDCVPKYAREYCDYIGYDLATETGVWGRPSLASQEKGEQRTAEALDRAVTYIRETFAELERVKGE
jgi:creatinine amidohydrolase